jgi:ribosomal protein L17
MGCWIDILKLGAEGKTGDARDLLEQIPQLLTGRVRSAVGRFINTLAADWRDRAGGYIYIAFRALPQRRGD